MIAILLLVMGLGSAVGLAAGIVIRNGWDHFARLDADA